MEEIRIIFKDNTKKKYLVESSQVQLCDFLILRLVNEIIYINVSEIKYIDRRKVD